jgi:ABC-type transport system substrate-binding protein
VISLRECGIEVELVNFEWLTYLGYWSGGIPEGENTGFFTMNMGTADVAGFDQYLHSASWPPAGWSMGWYANDDVDALIEKAWNATSHEEYVTAEREAHDLALLDYAYIPVLDMFLTYGVSDRVGGWTGAADFQVRFYKAFVEYERE